MAGSIALITNPKLQTTEILIRDACFQMGSAEISCLAPIIRRSAIFLPQPRAAQRLGRLAVLAHTLATSWCATRTGAA
ncbi:uncharacterized protein VTP21DRAFT_3036 [Calcarisporiella thermophila]|uniref:uncharacterized protein n=1 Tax=Calcarisporiella thermophila TaxID=911321 RepID=UPI0037439722